MTKPNVVAANGATAGYQKMVGMFIVRVKNTPVAWKPTPVAAPKRTTLAANVSAARHTATLLTVR